MNQSKHISKKIWLILVAALVSTHIFTASAAEKRPCDAIGNCLSSADAMKYRQAEAHITIENWQEANDLLGQLYVESLQNEESINFLVVNNYAVTLAKTGRPAVAALVLEKFFKELPGVGPGFQNLMQTYEFLAAGAESGITPAVDLLLINPESTPRQQRTEAVPPKEMFRDSELQNSELQNSELQNSEPQNSEVSPGLDGEITGRLDQYISTWEAGDIASYFSFYTPDHSPVNTLDYQDWQLQRRTRVRPDRGIRVTVSDLRIQLKPDGLITTEFVQDYQSSYYSDTTRKRLSWIQNIDGSWTIHQEVSLR